MEYDEAAKAVPAFFGLGQMGAALAGRMADSGDLIVSDLSDTARDALQSRGASAIAQVDDLPCQKRIVFCCLPTSRHVEDLLFGAHGLVTRLEAGSIVVDMTSGDPDMSIEIAKKLAGRAIAYADAPVSGGPQAANAGTIMIIVGSPAPLFSTLEPMLLRISSNVTRVGDIGAGHTLKLVNNLLAAGNRLLTFEAVGIAAHRGLDVARCIEVINKSSGRNNVTEVTFPRHILTGNVAQNFALALGHKDVGLARKLLPAAMEEIALAPKILQIMEGALSEYGSDADVNDIIHLYERASGARIAGVARVDERTA